MEKNTHLHQVHSLGVARVQIWGKNIKLRPHNLTMWAIKWHNELLV